MNELKELTEAVQNLLDSSDDTGCIDDLIVVSKECLDKLEEANDNYSESGAPDAIHNYAKQFAKEQASKYAEAAIGRLDEWTAQEIDQEIRCVLDCTYPIVNSAAARLILIGSERSARGLELSGSTSQYGDMFDFEAFAYSALVADVYELIQEHIEGACEEINEIFDRIGVLDSPLGATYNLVGNTYLTDERQSEHSRRMRFAPVPFLARLQAWLKQHEPISDEESSDDIADSILELLAECVLE